MACNFSLLCWNIGKSTEDKMKEYIYESKADLCFLQEARIGQVRYTGKYDDEKLEKAKQLLQLGELKNLKLRLMLELEKYKTLYWQESSSSSSPGSNAPCNCIIYNSNIFEVYKVRGKEVQCAVDEVTCDQESWHDDWPDREITSLKDFAKNDRDKRVCVAILQCNSIPSQPKIIVASCHILKNYKNSKSPSSAKHENIKKYAEKTLEELEELSKKTGYPLIVAGDFNCDLLESETLKYKVPKYDPTIHRVFCSGGNSNKIIDFFYYKNCDGYVSVSVNNVSADIVWPYSDHDLINWDKCTFPQYQKHLQKKSTLDMTPSDHDPLKAILNITDTSLCFPITYCNLEYGDCAAMVVKHFAKLNPQPELCIFQRVSISCKRFASLMNNDKYTITKSSLNCVVAYNKKLLSIQEKVEDNSTTYTFQYNDTSSFKLVILSSFNSKKPKEFAKDQFEKLSKIATSECPIVLVGGFYVDLFRVELCKREDIRYGFEVPEYSPTVFRMTHPYNTRDLYICCDFFTFRNCIGATSNNTTTVRISDVQAEMINPPQDLIRGSYNVNYDLIRAKTTEVFEVLKGTFFITSGLPPSDSESLVSSDPVSTPSSESKPLSDSESSDSDSSVSTPNNTSSGSKLPNSASSDKIHHHKTKVPSTAKSQKSNSKKKDSLSRRLDFSDAVQSN